MALNIIKISCINYFPDHKAFIDFNRDQYFQ
jgi:hypothetical protein